MELAEPGDQVPRLQAFEEAHPEITIIRPSQFSPTWAASRDDELLVARTSLKQFLDALIPLVARS
jgi:hypothetical protein